MIVNHSELASVLNVAPQTVAKYRAAGMPVIKEGSHGVGYEYDLDACAEWLKKHLEAQSTPSERQRLLAEAQQRFGFVDDTADADATLTPRDLKTLQDAVRAREYNELQRGTLLRRTDVETDYELSFNFIRTLLLGLPDRLQRDADLTDPQADLVHREVVRMIGQLHETLTRNADFQLD